MEESDGVTVTVFGLQSQTQSKEQNDAVNEKLSLLYPPVEYSAKELKKMEKMMKFLKKKKDAAKKKAKSTKNVGKKIKNKKEITFTPTPSGEKKKMEEMPPSYHPEYVQDGWYDWWQKKGFFKPEYNEGETKVECLTEQKEFTIIIPPPNVTGSLHIGHALTTAVEDSLTRWHRQLGQRTLWNPGCDHAGIATQSVVEKKLWREKKLRRQDLGRDEFLKLVWEWKEKKGGQIYNQIKYLGASCDWDREAFTMSERCCYAVKEAFIRMHKDGIIKREKRLVNWSCHLNSAISELEVDKVDITRRTQMSVPSLDDTVEVGVITSFAYKLKDSEEEIVVATTRPETMLGDVAIAVHPNDKRYTHLHGKKALHPFIDGRELVVVADDFVEMDFGTGAVKITPAHDQNDFDCGVRHNLEMITIITKDGNISAGCGEFSGMHRFAARKLVISRLKEKGLFRGDNDNPMVVPKCSRSGDIIEPLLETQWFVDCNEMAARSVDAVTSGELKLIPSQHEKTWFHWLENPRDWCISRQLWWGHRIPAYFVSINDSSIKEGSRQDNHYWISAHTEEEALKEAAKRFGVSEDKITLEQDEDVLDTWFSSGIYPISIFSWPHNTDEMEKFFPGHLLETGHDILFFWVARMVMMCSYLTGKLPFKDVFLHSIVRDKDGVKMSKSRGNVVDPIDVCKGIALEQLHERLLEGNLDPREIGRAKEVQKMQFPGGIKECGVDALRFSLCAFMSPKSDINLDVQRIFGYRTFCNKIYNGVKLVMSKLGSDYTPLNYGALQGQEDEIDMWMLHRLSVCTLDMNEQFGSYDFQGVTTSIYNLWFYEFCNFYLEAIKHVFVDGVSEDRRLSVCNVLYTVCESALRLLSPLMPYLSEELWQRLPRRQAVNDKVVPESVTVAAYPTQGLFLNKDIEKSVSVLQDVINKARAVKSSVYKSSEQPQLRIVALTDTAKRVCVENTNAIAHLVRAKLCICGSEEEVGDGFARTEDEHALIFLQNKL
eukprot:m.69527 g.69527  ORF g.69527 m.69527 type:complete len:998 (+) comp11633_c0_seq1:860-3853(+)